MSSSRWRRPRGYWRCRSGLRTTAVQDGDEYVVNGSKTFVTNGINSGLVIRAVETDPGQRHADLTADPRAVLRGWAVPVENRVALNASELSPEDAAIAKWWSTELQGRVIGPRVQLHGGYGYMLEYPIAGAFVDARVTPIYGGTTEIIKEIIGRSLGVRRYG